jgi:hypothetical protein
MEECKIVILIFACDTVEKYRNPGKKQLFYVAIITEMLSSCV